MTDPAPVLSPASDAPSPPRERQEETITRIIAAMCFDAQSDTAGRRSNRHRGRHAAREILAYLDVPVSP